MVEKEPTEREKWLADIARQQQQASREALAEWSARPENSQQDALAQPLPPGEVK